MKTDQSPCTTLRAIGVIAKVFGIKGELKVHSYARLSGEFEELGSVLVGKSELHAAPLKIEKVATRGEDIYLTFEGIRDRNAAELLVGHFLFVEESRRKQLESGEYFVDDLIGLTVCDTEKKNLGVLQDVVRYGGAQDMYVVRTDTGDVMVPAVKSIVRSVDLKSRTITIDPPEGLFGGETA